MAPVDVLDAKEVAMTYPAATSVDMPMGKINPRSTRAQRMFAHKAKMNGKVYDRARRAKQRTQIETQAQLRRLIGTGSIAQFNRHTGRPHENAREIMRRTMTIAERRAFAASFAAKLGVAA